MLAWHRDEESVKTYGFKVDQQGNTGTAAYATANFDKMIKAQLKIYNPLFDENKSWDKADPCCLCLGSRT